MLFLSIKAIALTIAPKVGSINTFISENGLYSIDVKFLGYPDGGPSECVFKEGDSIIWAKEISTTPGKVNISNNGKSIVLANWGWYDEGGFRSLSFYNGKGELLKMVDFGDKGLDSMLWIMETAISPNGIYYIFGVGGQKRAEFYLYDCGSAKLLWRKEYGFENVVEIEISDKNILVATFDYDSSDMLYTLLNIKGNMLWQREIKGNHYWDIKDYLHLDSDGRNFEIFDKEKGEYISFIKKDGDYKMLITILVILILLLLVCAFKLTYPKKYPKRKQLYYLFNIIALLILMVIVILIIFPALSPTPRYKRHPLSSQH